MLNAFRWFGIHHSSFIIYQPALRKGVSMSPWRTVGFRAVKLAGLALAVASCARSDAQQAIQQQVLVQAGNANAPENADARDSNEGVVAPESTNAMDQLALAQKME